MSKLLLTSAALMFAMAGVACQGPVTQEAPSQQSEPVPGHVTDLQAFDAFVATHPSPEAFRRHYPDVTLVLPGTVATKEFRTNNSRYFAEIDDAGKIVGGRFM